MLAYMPYMDPIGNDIRVVRHYIITSRQVGLHAALTPTHGSDNTGSVQVQGLSFLKVLNSSNLHLNIKSSLPTETCFLLDWPVSSCVIWKLPGVQNPDPTGPHHGEKRDGRNGRRQQSRRVAFEMMHHHGHERPHAEVAQVARWATRSSGSTPKGFYGYGRYGDG